MLDSERWGPLKFRWRATTGDYDFMPYRTVHIWKIEKCGKVTSMFLLLVIRSTGCWSYLYHYVNTYAGLLDRHRKYKRICTLAQTVGKKIMLWNTYTRGQVRWHDIPLSTLNNLVSPTTNCFVATNDKGLIFYGWRIGTDTVCSGCPWVEWTVQCTQDKNAHARRPQINARGTPTPVLNPPFGVS